MQTLAIGDVIEFEGAEGPVSALVLLAHDDAAIIDLCDGTTPLSVLIEALGEYRVYRGDETAVSAA